VSSLDCPGLLVADAAVILQWRAAHALPSDKQIHEARVAVKTLRAGLALMRPWLDERPLKVALRAFSRYLASSRDLKVAISWLKRLRAQHSTSATPCIDHLQQLLVANTATQPLELAQLRSLAETVAQALALLPYFQPRLEHWQARARHFCQRLCQRGPEFYLAYGRSGDSAQLHNWRKLVKRVYYQQRLLEPWGVASHLTDSQLKKLGSLLGEVQDLSVLEFWLERFKEQLKPITSRLERRALRHLLHWQREARLVEATALQQLLLKRC